MPRNGAPTRERILETAERLVIDNGFSGTSVDEVIAASGTSKGAFFHHFASKADLARSLVDRYVAADVAHLEDALARVAPIDDPVDRVLAFVRIFEDQGDELMSEQSSCLYIAVVTERQLVGDDTTDQIVRAIEVWREGIGRLLEAALAGHPERDDLDVEALADHVFATFEGAFVLARSTGDPGHMRRQLGALRHLLEALLRPAP